MPAMALASSADGHARNLLMRTLLITSTLHKFSEQYHEAKSEDVTISVSLTGSGSPTVSYTGKQGANGMCEETEEAPQQ